MVASAGEVHYALHTGSARGAPKLISPAVTEEGGDFGAWLGARCVLVRCAMPLQLRLYGMKVRRLGATTAQQCAGGTGCIRRILSCSQWRYVVWDVLCNNRPRPLRRVTRQ